MTVLSTSRESLKGESARVQVLIAQLNTLLEAPQASAHLVAAGRIAIGPLREFLLDRKPQSVPEPRIWAVRALAGLGADDVLLEFLRRPIASDDAILRFAEESVRDAAARALAASTESGVDGVLLRVAEAEHLPAALAAVASRNPDQAIPVLIHALEDDFARDAATEALHRYGVSAREALLQSAIDPGKGSEASLRRRRASVELLGRLSVDQRTWDRLQPVLAATDSALVCTVARVGTSAGANPASIVRRLLEILPDIGWEWLSTAEDMVVQCAIRDREACKVLTSHEPKRPLGPTTQSTWRRICHRVAEELRDAVNRDL